MLIPILLFGVFFIVLENLMPNEQLPSSKGWYKRVIIVNVFQLLILILAAYTWDVYFEQAQLFHLEGFPNFVGGFFAYLFITFIFYWWHRLRHTNNRLWLLFHQLHHSPQRIETITSFYKHPLEIIVNTILLSIINYMVFGLSVEAAAWSLFYSAVGEYIYHVNIKTPHAMGYIFQRPEMHRIHHERGKHFYNFSDLPVWDMLFGTFKNPKNIKVKCGFKSEREEQLIKMLFFKNVNNVHSFKNKKMVFKLWRSESLYLFLVFIGLIQSVGFMSQQAWIKSIGMMTVASPLPIVFTEQKGLETFASDFFLEYEDKKGEKKKIQLTSSLYQKLNAPYNYRNVLGAAISYAPILPVPVVDSVLVHAFQKPGKISLALGLEIPLKNASIVIKTKTEHHQKTYNISIKDES